jgi:tetraacyldisaccharide 4'-kinase
LWFLSAVTLGPVGAPFASLYGLVTLIRRLAYDRGWLAAADPGVRTISVGGLEAGGSGKTPVAGFLLRSLVGAGRAPGLLTRGYGRASRGLVVRRVGERADPARLGDEPAMLVRGGLDLPIAACARRVVGAARLVELGCDTLVLDDGFAHRALARHVDIVVLRGEQPLGNGHLLPWGSLREPPSSLGRADVVWHHFRGEPGEARARLVERAPGAVHVASSGRPAGPLDAAGNEVLVSGQRVVAAAGIARPTDLSESASRLGLEVVATRAFADHHRYAAADVRRLAALAEAENAAAVLVTEKDAVKLAPIWRGPPLWTIGVRVLIHAGMEQLAARLGIPAECLLAAE